MGNTTIIAGHNLGLGDTSARLLNRNDPLGNGSLDKNQSAYINVANGNLVIQEQDVLLTSQGDDFSLVRTYNSRGKMGGADNWGWTWSTGVTLSRHADKVAGKNVDAYEIVYGDGSSRHFDYDSTRALWVATDGAGAYETLAVAADKAKNGETTYTVTRADQSIITFDKSFTLLSIVDTNGVRMDYDYQGGRLVRIRDDSGYAINMSYTTSAVGTVSTTVLDNMASASGVTLVKYGWTAGKLTSVTDRYGHVTTYTYDANKLLDSITLPDRQTVNGQVQSFDQRRIQFSYQAATWSDTPHVKSTLDNGPAYALADMTDATGAKTSFEYSFRFGSTIAADDRDARYQYNAKTALQGGLTRVIDALGNARATANDAESVAWRQARGYYATYNAATVAANATFKAQYAAIRNAQSVSYQYDADGYLTGVTDELGFQTTYAYDARDNLTAVTDRNGYGVTASDSSYYRLLRKDLGYVDAGGNGKLVRDLGAAEKTALLNRYTTRYSYDSFGNMLSATDNAGNRTSWTYTGFNKLASQTSAVGNALAASDDAASQQKRIELGYPAALASLSAAQKGMLQALYTTTWQYDLWQNLRSRTDPGGDLTRFEYDAYGNLTRRIVFLDRNDLVTASRQQVTAYAYDAYGNNTSIRDAEGYLSTYQYDPFGNLLRAVDGRGNASTYNYDADNRLLAATDPEGHTTAYAYDAVGNTIAVSDASGHTVTRIYDRANRLLSVFDPAASGAAQDRRTRFGYDVLGDRTQVSDAEGRVTRYRFDERRQVVEIASPQVIRVGADNSETLAGYTSTLAYDGENNVVTRTDNNGNITQQLYASNGLLKRLTDPTGNVTEYLYDANLNRLQITIGVQLPAGQRRVLRFGYDQKNRKARTIDALGAQVLHAYDASDNLIAVTDENGNTTSYGYDRNDRLLTVTRPQVTDPRTGLSARYAVLHRYDAVGNEVATTDENGNTGTTVFDRANRKVMTTDANGVVTVFAYDSRDKLTRVSMGVQASANADGGIAVTSASDARVTSYTYDEFRQLVAMTDGVGNALLSSDLQAYQDMRTAQGLPALAASLSAAQKSQITQAYTERYGHDRVGNLTARTDHLGRITQTAYDALDRVTGVTEAVGLAEQRVTNMRYDGNGNLVSQRDADGRVTTMRYDGMDRMVGMTDGSNALTTTQYDNVGNRVQMQEGTGTAAARTSSWVYDLDNRVTSETTGEGRNRRYEYDAVGNRLKITDGVGNATRYVYDAMNRNVRVIDPKSFETRYEYDGVGNQLTMVDARGGVQRVSYDAGNRRIVTTDAEGRVARFEYDVLDHMVTQTTAAGTADEQTSRYLYDAENNLRQVIDAAGVRSASQYDAAYNQVASTDSRGNVTLYGFDALNRQISVTDALGHTTRYGYDAMQNRLTETDPLNRVRSFQYDAVDRRISETDALGVQTRYVYDAVGNEVTITHAANRPGQARTQSFVYDRDGLLLQKTDALGQSTGYSYDGNGNMTQATDAKGQVTRYRYDACQRVEVITDAEGYVTRYAYDGNGNRVSTTDAGNNSWITYYNSDNEADLTVDAQGYATTRTFDANGNMVEETRIAAQLAGAIDPAARPALQRDAQLDQTVRYGYDRLNRVGTQTDAMGYTRGYSHDAAGKLLAETDENGNTTTYRYDSANRLVSRIDALGGVRLFAYDDAGNLVSETDPNGNTTTSVYDSENRLLVQTDALGGATRYSYDSVGNLLTQTDANGHTASYGYDSNNRMLREVDASGGVSTYAYDAEGNRIRSTDANGNTVTTWYDRKHRATLSIDAMGYATAWQYDGMGNLRSRIIYMTAAPVPSSVAQLPTLNPGAGDQATTWTYDRRNRLTRQVDAGGGVTTYAYDMAGNQVQMTDANGNLTSTWYDRDNRAVLSVDAMGYATAHSYDAAGNILLQTRYMSAVVVPGNARPVPVASAADQTVRYAYDAGNRLLARTDASGGVWTMAYDAVGNTVQSIDANGHASTSYYDAGNRLVLQVDAMGSATGWRYDAVGNMLSEQRFMTALATPVSPAALPAPAAGAADQTTSYAYDAGNRRISRTDARGGIWRTAYDAAGNAIRSTDANGHVTSRWYDRDNREVLTVDALGYATTLRYDALANVLSQTRHMTALALPLDPVLPPVPAVSAGDQTTVFAYDRNNRRMRQVDALGNVTTTSHDAMGNRIQSTDANGHVTSYAYDADNRLIRLTDALNQLSLYAYDAAGNNTGMTDANGHVTAYAYDRSNRLVRRTDALNHVTTTRWDAVGNRVGVTDANGNTTSYAYDAVNRQTEVSDALKHVTRSAYDAVGNRTRVTDANGNSTVTRYDASNQAVEVRDALDQLTRNTYDAAGNLTMMTDANGHATAYAYDAANRLATVTDALGNLTRYAYDAAGNRTVTTDANGHTSRSTYDAANRRTAMTDALGNTTGYGYDAVGKQTRQTDARGYVTTSTYDAVDRLVQIQDALGNRTTYTYDAVGNRSSATDALGKVTSYVYDAADRLLQVRDPLGNGTSSAWDAVGNRTSVTDANGNTTRYAYDAVNWLSSQTDALGYRTSYRYDALGNIIETSQQLSLGDASSTAVTRNRYDAANRLSSTRSAAGYLRTYRYDAAGKRTGSTVFDAAVGAAADPALIAASNAARRDTGFAYDAADRLVSQTSALGIVTAYDYDAVGNRITIVEAQGTAAARRNAVAYDAANRVVATTDAAGVVTRMARDALGNILRIDDDWDAAAALGQRSTVFAYDALSRISTQTDALGYTSRNSYDAVGNLVQRDSAVGIAGQARTEKFEYDANRRQTAQVNGEGERSTSAYDGMGNRLALIVAPGAAAQRVLRYRYDADNRLIGQTDGNGIETQYRYDGAGNKTATIQLAAVHDGSGAAMLTYQGVSIAGQSRETRFAYDLDKRLVQVTDPLAGVTAYTLDVLGNRTKIVDAMGHETRNTFDAAGHLTSNLLAGAGYDGVLVTNLYDRYGNIVQSQRGYADGSDMRRTSYAYDALDRQTSITEYDLVATLTAATVFTQAYSTVFQYDAYGNQVSVSHGRYLLGEDDDGYSADKAALAFALTGAFTYDALDRQTGATDDAGNLLAVTYDAYGNRLTQTTGAGAGDARTVTFAYDKADRMTRRQTGTGAVIRMAFDAAGNQVSEATLQSGSENGSAATGDAPVWSTETYQVDGNGRVVMQTSALGVATARVIDAFGNEVETRLAAGSTDQRVLRQEFNANNDLLAQVDALGNRTVFTVDALGMRTSETDARGYTTRFYYNERNEQTATLDVQGYLVGFRRDAAGNVLGTSVYLGQYSAPAGGGAPAPLAADAARITTNTYDSAGNLVSQTGPDQRLRTFVHDSAGKLRSITDAGNIAGATARVERFGYDAAGRRTSYTRADGVVETYAYDSAGNRTTETITAYRDDHTVLQTRSTSITFDADNRQTGSTFDAAGLNLTVSIAYDKAGNVIGKTDAMGNVTRTRYDLGNQILSITDAATAALAQTRATSNAADIKAWRSANGYYQTYDQASIAADAVLTAQYNSILALETQTYSYDRAGNRTRIVDAMGYATDLGYDLDNRVTLETRPGVDVFTIRDGLQSGVRPTIASVYDAVGNLVETTDANGGITSYWYDGNRQQIAELNGDNVFRSFSYDAAGLLVNASLYMTRLADSARDPAALPTAPTGEIRTVANAYDAAGRLTKTTYPQITVTTLSGAGGASPTAATASVRPEESVSYDAYGNRARSVNRNGNAAWNWYDSQDRIVASVDEAGYLTEFAYDDQGNVVRQTRYATALDTAALTVARRPGAPAGAAYLTDRVYDKASRLLSETLPTVTVDTGAGTLAERPVTRFSYDRNGKLVRKRLAADTASETSEYSYYDAAGRQVAVVNALGVLHTIGYDANGNKVAFQRYLTPLARTSAQLAGDTLATLLAAVSASASGDQQTTYAYDAGNRQVRSTDLMGAGDSDDIVIQTWYDAAGLQSKRIDPDGYTTRTAHDALGHITQTVSPDGNRAFIEYDAAGLQTLAWTGDLGSNAASAATGVTASIGDTLAIGWTTSGRGLTTWVAWDTVAHDKPADYASTSARQGGGSASTELALAGVAAGAKVYFRVVTVDAAGSSAWTAESSITVPVMMSSVSIAAGATGLAVTVVFNGAATAPQLRYGATGSAALGSTVNFVLQGGNTWKATIASPSGGGQGLSWQLAWTANGSSYTTAATPFDAPGVHAATGPVNKWTVGWPVPAAAQGTSQLVLLGGARVDNAFQVNGQLQFDPGSIAVNSSRVVQVFYGNAASTTHTATVSWSQLQKQSFSAGQPATVVVGANTFYDTTWNVSWINDSSSALKTSVSTTLASTESAMVNAGGVRVAYRTAGSGATFSAEAALARGGNTYSAELTLTAGASYDLKFFYIDTSGSEVIIEWRTVSVPAAPSSSTASPATVVTRSSSATAPTQPTPASPRTISVGSAQTFGGKSLTVLGRETDGSLSRGSGNALSVDAGLYSGPVDPGAAAFSVVPVATASAGAGSLKASGLSASTYYTESVYDAIGNKVATNENTGLWRRYGVDAMGNALRTSVYGTKADETAGSSAVVTYAAYDARGLEAARFGAAVVNDSNADGVDDAAASRAVTRISYDYDRRKIGQTDPGNSAASAQTYTYDGLGQLVAQKDALGNTTSTYYDRRGHEVRRVDGLSHAVRSQYDLYGRKTGDTDGLGNVTRYGYDAFDRMTMLTDARGNISTLEYDQHDRLVKVSDALGNITQYSYDKRDNRTWTRDANDNFFGVAYDEMRRVSARYSFQGGAPTSFADAADAVSGSANAAHAFLVAETAGYDVYGNKIIEVDAEKRQKVYSYGAFGRLATQADEASRVTSYTYDRFGRLSAEARADDDTTTGARAIARTYDDAGRLKSVTDAATLVATSYTYTAAGLRAHETVRAPGFASAPAVATVRNIGYAYDAAGRMTLWTDAATGANLAYSYDAAGNLSRVWSSDYVVDHRYSYDAANRLSAKTQGAATTLEAYTYDAYGNRATYNDGSNTATTTWNAANRVTQAVTTANGTPGDASDDTKASWSYDKVGNVTRYEEFDKTGASIYIQTSAFNQSYRTLTSATTNRRNAASVSIASTEYTLDKSGRLSKEVSTDTSSTSKVYTYTHAYTLDGRELSVTASGTGSLDGSAASTYDANDKLSRIDLGTPDGDGNSASYKLFRYSNDGQVLTGFYDNGVAADKDVTTNYLYANGNIVGQKGNSTSSDTVATLLDEKAYSLFDTIGADHPAGASSSYEVQAGDTLQSIAARQYGNPSLWYAIADTNDLTGAESLKPGTRLMLPGTTDTGRLTADNHVVYNESAIIGSRLPSLKAPPPPEPDKCAQAAAIILTILVSIVAVVVTVLTAGALAPLAIAAAGVTATSAAGIIIGATVGAVVGATIGLASGAINQGIKIGLKVQTDFNWKEVAADVAAGAIGGVGAAFSGVAQASVKAAVAAQELSVNLGRLARVATVLMDSAINVAGEASSQAITYNGRIEEPWMLGVAGGAGIVGEVLKPLGSRAWRAIRPTALGRTLRSAGSAARSGAGKVFRYSDSAGRIVSGTADGVTSASDNGVAATLRKSDVQLASGTGGKQQLTVRFADDALTGNMRTSAYTPVSWNDTAAATLSRVQSQSTLDQVADLAPLMGARKMLAGETSGFDHATVSDFAQGSVGRVRDNSIPVSQLDTGTRASARLSQVLSPDDRWSRDIDALLEDIDDIARPGPSVISDADDTPDLHLHAQDAAPVKSDLPAPQTARRGRALGQAETSLPEPSLDLRKTIDQSRVDRPFDFKLIDGDPKQARKTLEDYFAANDITLSKSPAKLAQQVQQERAYLKALKPRGLVGKRELDLQLNDFDQKVSAYEISRSSQTRKLLSTYQDLRSRPLASAPGGRNQQFLDIDDTLGNVLANPKLSQATRLLVKNEMQLIRDTVSDAQIMKSAYLLNPSHAMELKRLGLQASAAGRIGEFTDVRLTGNMTKLGSGNLNTVYIGNYTLPDGGGAYKGVFKPEVRQWTEAPTSGVYLGIDPLNPRAGYRNVATTRLDEALGFQLITRSEMAIHNNELGTVSELALGVSPKAGKMKSNEIVPDEVIAAFASTGKPGAPLKDDWLDDYNATRGEGRMIYQETVAGRQQYVYEGTAVHDINYEDPRLRRDLVRLHLMDAISGQVDRHHGNYFVLTDHAGKVVDVKAIDNDLSWGNNLKMVEVFDTGWHTRPEDAIHLPKYLPPVVDKEAYDAVMALNRQSLAKKMGGLLNGDEIDAAAERLRLVQNHLKTLDTQGRVLASRDEWASPQVTRLLMERKEGRVTNYIARESGTIEKARGKGVLLAYPQNRMAAPA